MISPRAFPRSIRRPTFPYPSLRLPNRVGFRSWRHVSLGHLAWLALWAPWWVGNDMPPPGSPRRTQPLMIDVPAGSAGAWLLDQLDDLRFRFGLTWALALLLRGAWLGGVAGIFWVLLAQAGALPSPTVYQLLPLVLGGAALGLALRMFHRPTYRHVAQMLDATFALRSRITTAVTGLRFDDSRTGGMHELQLADAANALGRSRSRISREQWLPVREIFLVCIVAVVLLFLLIAQPPEGQVAPVSATGIPGFVPISKRLAEAEQQQVQPPEIPDAATLQEVEDISRDSNQAREDLDAIGEALDGSSVTSSASDAIAEGDYAEANQELSDSAVEVMRLPEADRQQLADDLDDASERVSEENQELSEAAQDAAGDVRSGEDTGALNELGERIQETGESVISQDGSESQLPGSSSESSSGSEASSDGGEQSGAPSEPQAGQGDSSSGAPQPGDPGSGMEASGGVDPGSEGDGPGEGEGSQGQGGENPGQGADAPAGTSDEIGGEGQGSPDSDDGQAPGAAGDASQPGESGEDDGGAQGSGAGGGSRETDEQSESDTGSGSDLDNEDQAPEAGEGEAGDPPPGGDGGDGDSATTNVPDTDASITLQGSSDDRVRSGSDIGSSSVGSGGGVGAASGDSAGGTSGSAGPDPNAVPETWRQLVEDYFRDGGAP